MSISEENKIDDVSLRRASKTNLIEFVSLSFFCVVFNFIYGKFSHGVSSDYMTYAFLVPLWGGVVPYFALMIFSKKMYPNHIVYGLYNAGIITFMVGSLFQGVLEIYGTTNELVYVYVIAGVALVFFGVVLYIEQIVNLLKSKNKIS